MEKVLKRPWNGMEFNLKIVVGILDRLYTMPYFIHRLFIG